MMEYEPGSYFGELALLSSEPRAANIIAQVRYFLKRSERCLSVEFGSS